MRQSLPEVPGHVVPGERRVDLAIICLAGAEAAVGLLLLLLREDRVYLPQSLFGSYDTLERATDVVESRDGQGRKGPTVQEVRSRRPACNKAAWGNCWLLAAIGAIAEAHPEIIRSLFLTNFVEPCGIYRIRLYDVRYERWTTVVIDDRIPMTDDGMHPRFSRPNGPELWVLLLEKAFARALGAPTGISRAVTSFWHCSRSRATTVFSWMSRVLPKYIERPVLRRHPWDFVAWFVMWAVAAEYVSWV